MNNTVLKKKRIWKFRNLILLMPFLFISCSKQSLFYSTPTDLGEMEKLKSLAEKVSEPTLRNGDRITISIWGHDNLSIGSLNSVYSSNEETGKWVTIDQEGEVNLPKIGRIELVDLSIMEASHLLEQAYSDHVTNPIVNVKVLNHEVTVLGEFSSPRNYELDYPSNNLIHIIGKAGGLTENAKAKKVVILRGEGETVERIEIDLTQMNSLYVNTQLYPNDIVYIPPAKSKKFAQIAAKLGPFVGILSGAAVLIPLLSK